MGYYDDWLSHYDEYLNHMWLLVTRNRTLHSRITRTGFDTWVYDFSTHDCGPGATHEPLAEKDPIAQVKSANEMLVEEVCQKYRELHIYCNDASVQLLDKSSSDAIDALLTVTL
jgi:hypothetical protein